MISFRSLLAAGLLLLFPAIGFAGFLAALPRAVAGQPVLAIPLLPYGDAARKISALGGYPVRLSQPPIGHLVHSQAPDFVPRLKALRGILTLDGTNLPDFLCDANV